MRTLQRAINWVGETTPQASLHSFPAPNDDTPDAIRKDYLEAASIAADSPRGAAALLRLCVQKLCLHLGYEQEIDRCAIAAMIAHGLPSNTGKALDILRVIGNNAVNPGQIDADDTDIAIALAGLFI